MKKSGNAARPEWEETPAQRALAYRAGLLASVTPEDVTEIGRALVERAKTGDPAAARLVLDRLCGTKTVPEWETRREMDERDMFRA